MTSGIFALASVVVIAFASVPTAAAAPPFAPLAVEASTISTTAGSLAFVAWTRGSETADYYIVYGVDGSSLQFLTTETDFSTPAPAGYTGYAVTGVKDGTESDATFAQVVPCIDIFPYPPPPDVAVSDCVTGIGVSS
jgi:hypothetical protein